MFKPILAGACALLVCAAASAQQYPTKPVTMLVPYAAGGPTDTVARVMGIAMGSRSGRPSWSRTGLARAASLRPRR